MKLEEIKNKTNEAVSYLVAALESGQSDVLTQYLNAMALEMWWPGTELNRRRQPFQTLFNLNLQQGRKCPPHAGITAGSTR